MSKPLPESIKQQIKTESETLWPSTLGMQAGVMARRRAYSFGATRYMIQYLAEKERADQLEAILEDKLTGPEGNKTAASDAYYELARMLLGGLPGSAIETLSALQGEVHELRARAVKAERDAQTAEQETQTLNQWKAEATEVMAPIYDWFHKQKDIPLGSRMGTVILQRLSRVDRLESYLDRIATGAAPYNDREAWSWIETARQLANEAINPQTDKTE